MDKIFSARMDETVIRQIGRLAERLKTSKKAVVEKAVKAYAETIEAEGGGDAFERTLGAWKRAESPDVIRERGRKAFLRSMRRHRR